MTKNCPIVPLPAALGAAIDYTDLRKEVTYSDIEALCLEACTYKLGTVVVPSMLVRHAASCLDGAAVVSTVIGYPFGTQAARVKAEEARDAVAGGALRLEAVPHFGILRAERWGAVTEELHAIRQASGEATLSLILETSALTPECIGRVCALAAEQGYAFVANTIGFRTVSTRPDTQGVATPEAIGALVRQAGGRIGVKAIGGEPTLPAIERLLTAGAARVALEAQRGLLRRLVAEEGVS